MAERDQRSYQEYQTLMPTAREVDVVRAAINRARRFGLTYRPSDVEIRMARELDGAWGRCFWLVRPVRVLLLRGMSDRRLFEVVLHELKHAADALSDCTYPYWAVDEQERSAEAFAAIASPFACSGENSGDARGAGWSDGPADSPDGRTRAISR